MSEVMTLISDFVKNTKFGDLPENVVHEMKRLTLDSTGCAMIGHISERGKIAAKQARRLAGPQDATIIGTSDKVASANAAFANGELMNALDFDALSIKGRHDVPVIMPILFALTEERGGSGKDLILATAVSMEVSQRIKSVIKGIHAVDASGDKMLWPMVTGYSSAVLGGVCGGSLLAGLDGGRIEEAIGIGGYNCPPSTFRKFLSTSPVKTIKYGSSGWGARAGVEAILLAEMGYGGDTELFETDYGFWQFTGNEKGDGNMVKAFTNLGKEWLCDQIQYKQYPGGL